MAHLGWHVGTGWHVGWHFGGTVPGIGGVGATTIAMAVESGATVTYEWRTDVLKAWSGLEQRVGLLSRPRQRYELSSLLTDAQSRSVLGMLAGNAHGAPLFLLGLAFEALTVVSSTSTTVTVASLARCDWAEVGQRIVVVHPNRTTTAEAVVQSVAGATITIDANVTAAAVEGAQIMPAVGVYLEDAQALGRFRTQAGRWSIGARAARFRYGYSGSVGVGATVTTYDGLPVWDFGVGLDGARGEGLRSGAELVDAGAAVGSVAHYDASDWMRQVKIESSSRVDWQWLKRFLDTIRGRCVAFLLATGRPDLVPVGTAATGKLTIENSPDYVAQWWPSLAHRRLQIVLADGSVNYRKVTEAVDNGNGTQTLTLDSALAGTIDHVELLETVRLEADEIRVEWRGNSFASAFEARVVQA